MDIILVGCILEVSGGFLRTPRKLDLAAVRGPIRPPPEPPQDPNMKFFSVI